jgi:hypothetical protein
VRPIARQTQPWLRHISFSFDLDQVASATFRIGDDIKIARDNIPVLGEMLRNIREQTMASLNSPAIWGALITLALMLGVAAFVVNKRVKPE